MSEHTKHQAFDPSAKTFKQRLAAFLHYVFRHYGLHITQDRGRTDKQAQAMHVCHMFLYNSFNKQTTPKNTEPPHHRTISWAHMSDAKVVWENVDFKALLSTRDGRSPEKEGGHWKKGFEPDLGKSKEKMQKVLNDWGAAKGKDGLRGSAMTACGFKCGEPCGCPVGISKHVRGIAADLNRDGIHILERKLRHDKAGSVDELLAFYGLHRPLLHHANSPEEWHIEAKPHFTHKKHRALGHGHGLELLC